MQSNLYIKYKNNAMIYRLNDDETLFRFYDREVTLKMDNKTFSAMMEIMKRCSENPRSINDLVKIAQDDLSFKMALKVMKEFNMIFILNEEGTEFVEDPVYKIFEQYAYREDDIVGSLKKIKDIKLNLSPGISKSFPYLKKVLDEYGIHYKEGNDLYNFGKTTLDISFQRENVFENSEKGLVILDNPDAFYAYRYNETSERAYIQTILGNLKPQSISKQYEKVISYYLLVYIIKHVLNLSKNLLIVTHEFKFYEKDVILDKYMDTLPLSTGSFPKEVEEIKLVEEFEKMIENNVSFIKSVGRSKNYSKLSQAGYSAYGIGFGGTAKECFSFGLDYIKNAASGIKFGLKNYLEEATGHNWLVTDMRNYYYDKVHNLLNHIQETSEVAEVLTTSIPIKLKSYWDHLNTYGDFSLYVKEYPETGRVQWIITSLKDGKTYEGKPTILKVEGLEEILINCLAFFENMKFGYCPNLIISTKELGIDKSNGELDWKQIKVESSVDHFIENSLKVMKKYGLKYEEDAWIYEGKFKEAGLIVRRIEVV